jgi:hypothetical protein
MHVVDPSKKALFVNGPSVFAGEKCDNSRDKSHVAPNLNAVIMSFCGMNGKRLP